MKVTLRAIGYIFNITKYVDLPIAQTKTLTGGFDTAQLIIPFVRANAVVNLDLSRKIPRMAIVEIEDLKKRHNTTSLTLKLINLTQRSIDTS